MRSAESWEKLEIDNFLKSVNGLYYFCPATGGYGGSGHSDRIGCYKARFFSIEVKREGKEPTPIQYHRMSEVALAGGMAFAGTAAVVIPKFKAWMASL